MDFKIKVVCGAVSKLTEQIQNDHENGSFLINFFFFGENASREKSDPKTNPSSGRFVYCGVFCAEGRRVGPGRCLKKGWPWAVPGKNAAYYN